MSTYVNAAPKTDLLGIQDKSTREQVLEREVLPTLLSKTYIFAQKGRTTPQLCVGSTAAMLYGEDTFDLRKPFAKHTTVLSNLLNAQGNAQMIERVIPKDAKPEAGFVLYLDVIRDNIPVYNRTQSGLYVVDSNTGMPVKDGTSTVPGYKCKWLVTAIPTTTTDGVVYNDLEKVVTGPGTMTNGSDQSTKYPVLVFWADSRGSYYNNTGLRIWAPNVNSTGGVNKSVIGNEHVYPFRMTAIKRSSATATARIKETVSGEPYFDFCLKPGVINSKTDAMLYLNDIYLDKYQTIKDPRFPKQYADLSGLKVYESNINELLGMFTTTEAQFAGSPGSDFSAIPTDNSDVAEYVKQYKYLFNFLSFKSSTGAPYHTAVLNTTDKDSVNLTENTNLFAVGGSDGTMSDTVFNELVGDAVSEYANPNSHLLDTAMYPESIIWDTGFPLETKFKLCNFLALRKDTAVALSVYEAGDDKLSASEEYSKAVALRTRLQMFPESDYFGTATCRGFVFGRSGILRNSQYKDRLPLTLDVAVKAAKCMGAGNGVWKADRLFDTAPNNIVNLFDDLSIGFTPALQRDEDWEVGLCYPSTFSRSQWYFPAIKSVYDDDTSVLNSFFTVMACVELQKVGERAHRQFSGATKLTNAQLVKRVNEFVEENTIGRFADMFKIVPAAHFTEADVARGYSWTLPILIYANNMRTTMQLFIQANRMSDYTGKN